MRKATVNEDAFILYELKKRSQSWWSTAWILDCDELGSTDLCPPEILRTDEYVCDTTADGFRNLRRYAR